MKVEFINEVIISEDTHCTAQIFWHTHYPMKGGKFPFNHPVSKETIDSFRARGYWASCYPEGDGITFYSLNGPKDDQQVVKDIEECFGFVVSFGQRKL